MSQNEIAPRQLWLWLYLAVSAPLAHFGGGGYMAAALAAGAMLPLSLLFGDGFNRMGRIISILEWAWLALTLAYLLPASGEYWPGTGSDKAVPLVLLALAAVSGGKVKSARAGSALFWLAAIMLVGIGLAAAGQTETAWMTPEPGEWNAGLIVTLLMPGLTAALLPEAKGKANAAVWVGVLAIGIAALLQGTLSIGVGLGAAAPMYELGRGLGGGFEILASVAVTLGWYGMCSLLFAASEQFLRQCGMRGKPARILTLAVVTVLILFGVKISGKILTGGSLVMWILLPMLYSKNKSKKDEKRC